MQLLEQLRDLLRVVVGYQGRIKFCTVRALLYPSSSTHPKQGGSTKLYGPFLTTHPRQGGNTNPATISPKFARRANGPTSFDNSKSNQYDGAKPHEKDVGTASPGGVDESFRLRMS